MTQLTARIDASGAEARMFRTVLASLPNSYRLTDGTADVVLTSGTEAETVAAACSNETRAVVVDLPGHLTPEAVTEITVAAATHDCVVIAATRFAPRLIDTPGLTRSTASLITSTISTQHDVASMFVEQLAMLRVVAGSVASIRVLHRSRSHHLVRATMANDASIRVVLDQVNSPVGAEEATVHVISAAEHLDVHIDARPSARPADITLFSDVGGRSPWPVHQHAHRITLSRLHAHLANYGELAYSLDDLRHDVQLASALRE